jgi:CRAL/TRIO domain
MTKTSANELITREALIDILQEKISDDLFWEKWCTSENDPSIVSASKQLAESFLHDEAHLDRLLVARRYQMQPTVDLFLEQIAFRVKYQPSQICPSSIANALPSGAWRLCGHTKDGYVISNYKLEFWNPDTYGDSSNMEGAVAEYTRYVCYMIELMIASMRPPHDKFVVIFDLKGFYLSMVTKSNVRQMIKKLIYVAQAQYPERLQKVYLVNAPYGFQTAWSLIRPLLDSKTSSKISFVSQESLLEDIDRSVLSKVYGGNHEEYPVPSKTIELEAYKME